jgi:hypothetical protein
MSVVGSWSTARRPGSIWADMKFSWPFGRIEVHAGALLFDVRGPIAPTYRRLCRGRIPVAIPFSAIERIEFGGRTAIVRSRSERFEGATFGARIAELERVLDRLAELGVRIARRRIRDLRTARD